MRPLAPSGMDSTDPKFTSMCGTTHGKGDAEKGRGRLLREVGLTGASFGLGVDRVTPTRDAGRTSGVGIYELSPSLQVQACLLSLSSLIPQLSFYLITLAAYFSKPNHLFTSFL